MALDLSGKIFGLPVPVVGGVIGLGLVALLYFRNSSQAAASAAPQTVAVPDVGPGDQVDSRGTQDGGSGAQTAVFTSNGTWTATALGWIVATQGASPLAVQSAIEKYLTGETLTYEQGQLMDAIIGKFGLPPQGVTGISTITPKSVKLVDPAVEPDDLPTAFTDYLNMVGLGGTGAAVVASNLAAGRAKYALPSVTMSQPVPATIPAQSAPADTGYVQKPAGTVEVQPNGEVLTYTKDGYTVRNDRYGYTSTTSFPS